MMIVMGFVFAGMGAPGAFVVFAFLAGVFVIVMSFVAAERRQREAKENALAAEEADEKFKDEVAEAVKERMKGTIKVRCRYCGSLNDEEAVKCDSCGATL